MSIWVELNPADEHRFVEERRSINFERTRWGFLVLAAIHVVHIALFAMADGNVLWRSSIGSAHAVGLGVALTIVLVGAVGRTRALVVSGLPVLGVFWAMTLGASLAAIDQLVTTAVTPLLVVNVTVPIFLRVRPRLAIAAQLFGLVLFVTLLPSFQNNPALRLTSMANATTFTALGAMLTVAGAMLHRKDFAQRQVIARQNVELQALATAAQAANAAKSRFLAVMSHEIRTPLNGVLGLTQLLERTDLAPSSRDLVTNISRAGRSLLTIINDLLDLSKIEAGKLTLEHQPVELRALVDSVVALHLGQAKEKNLSLESRWSDGDVHWISADETRLRQVLSNLVSNALKFTLRGGVRVEVTTKTEGNDVHLALRVIDTGVGMTDEQRQRLFVAFEQADSSTTRRYGGTGLGLAICRQLLEQMRGTIVVESSSPRGSAFLVELTLPAAQPVATPAELPATRFDARALVADDNALNVMVARGLLSHLGVEVLVAKDGQEALELLEREVVDVVFTDLHMPAIDGFELARRLRARGSVVPIVAVSASAFDDDRQRCLDAGMNDSIPKPLHQRDLERVLRTLAV
ncbi:MAG: ATP-binding protein [Myxococcaceae bacterium]